MIRPIHLALRSATAVTALVLASCATKTQTPASGAGSATKFVNPHPPGTYEHFTAEPSYPKTKAVWKNDELLSRTSPSETTIHLSVAKQRGQLRKDNEILVDYPICTGRSGHESPIGEFRIQEKIVDKFSNRYGKIYDANGDLVNGDADIQKDAIPEGGRFQGASMRYWMRLTGDGVGHHIAPLPKSRRPASHGCLRGPANAVPIVYSKVQVGTKVFITKE